MTNTEFKVQMEDRTVDFAAAVMNVLVLIPANPVTKTIIWQLSKSAASIGANYSEANHSESRDDFIHKLAIVVKETRETIFWLRLIVKLDFIPGEQRKQFLGLEKEAGELFAILNKAQQSARQNKTPSN